ncbi:hypothetical protein [uncultured Cellulomonas sp.]|uniref:hypothetical protein n=1 Tax=uncultured Cellulomonas sp. TaxID=189682 RepID=UPI00262C7D4E|nr:hypothetical protein [uncultured Cellulomonas sp.]
MDLHPWVVQAGSQAEVTGTVAQLTRGYGVVEDLFSEVLGDPGLHPEGPFSVAVSEDAHDAGLWPRLEGRRITVTGTWDGAILDTEQVANATAAAPPGTVTRADSTPPLTLPAAPLHGDHEQDLRRAELALWNDGTLVSRLEAPSRKLVYAAHDVARATRILHPLLGEHLEVVPSRWDKRIFDHRDAAVRTAEKQGLLIYVGESVRPDGYRRCFVGLRYVTDEIADLLAVVPDELVSVHALLTPAGRPLPPRPEDL